MKEVLKNINETLDEKKGNSQISFRFPLSNGGEFYSYLYIKKSSDKLYVMLNGALPSERKSSLIFHRYSWHSLFDGSVLYIADPTLLKHPELYLAWYSGCRDLEGDFFDLMEIFISKIKRFVNAKNIITYGSSGGGYAALQLASRIGVNCTAVAINPQTSILQYNVYELEKFVEICFQSELNKIDKEYLDSSKFNAIKAVNNSECKVIYIQNIVDTMHYEKHFLPFVSAFKIPKVEWTYPISTQNNHRIKLYIYSHPSGHSPEPKAWVKDIVEMINFINME